MRDFSAVLGSSVHLRVYLYGSLSSPTGINLLRNEPLTPMAAPLHSSTHALHACSKLCYAFSQCRPDERALGAMTCFWKRHVNLCPP